MISCWTKGRRGAQDKVGYEKKGGGARQTDKQLETERMRTLISLVGYIGIQVSVAGNVGLFCGICRAFCGICTPETSSRGGSRQHQTPC